MKINPIPQFTAVSWLLFASSALGGQWLDLYWPLNDGDHKTFIYEATKELTLDVNDFGGGEWNLCVGSPDVSECLDLQCDQTGCYLISAEAMGTTVSFDPPVLLLNENILQNGGTVKTVTTVTQFGLDPYPATYTVTVAKSGTVTVPAGTWQDCRSIKATEVATIPGYGTITASALTAYLGPKVGIIKTLVMQPSDFATLVSGTVGGVDVRCLAHAIPPQLTISLPKPNQRISNAVATVEGTAGKNLPVSAVRYQLNAGAWQVAPTTNGWTNWGATVNLQPGHNALSVYAVDACDRPSPTQSVSFTYVVSDRLAVRVQGNGSVAPNLDGKLLELGTTNQITATAGPSDLFSNWTGTIFSTNSRLKFVMQSNMVLQANFVPNRFVAVKGNYQGLFVPTSDPTATNYGLFTGTTTDKGSFSARLQLGGMNYSLSGKFSLEGTWSNHVAPAGLTPLTVQLQLDFATGDALGGQISDGIWTAEISANRDVFNATNPAPQKGNYTIVLPGDDDSVNMPGGEGIGTIKVAAAGKLQFSGTLADGTKVTQGAGVSRGGQWPLFALLGGRHGVLAGWMNFETRTNDDVNGILNWTRAAQASAKYYPGGFTLSTEAVGSKYLSPPTGSRVINVATGQVAVANGNLAQSFTNHVVLGTDNKVMNLSSNKLTMTITPLTGLFKGTVTAPGTTRSMVLNGVLLQTRNAGYGFFLGTNQSGRIYFSP